MYTRGRWSCALIGALWVLGCEASTSSSTPAGDIGDTATAADSGGASDTATEPDAAAPADVTVPADVTSAADAETPDDIVGAGDGAGADALDLSQCCTTDTECDGGQVCAEIGAGTCVDKPFQNQCWTAADCGLGFSCSGAKICPCGSDCGKANTPGDCKPEGLGCCETTDDCGAQELCLSGDCLPIPDAGTCYDDADCGGGTCLGAFVCMCGGACPMMTTLGTCTLAPPPGCCTLGFGCGDTERCLPVNGVGDGDGFQTCGPLLTAGQCFSDADCIPLTTCQGASVCPCGAQCDQATTPGTCVPDTAPAGCCGVDADCGPKEVCAEVVMDAIAWSQCVPAPAAGKCYTSQDCTGGDACEGAKICPCASLCGLGPIAGTCTPPKVECKADADCAPSERCAAGPTCFDWCAAGDPACCTGNVCTLCPAILPQGCSSSAQCEGGQICAVDDQCHSSSCTCELTTGLTACTPDCAPGLCVDP